jgi:carbon-monoxide dehydrogenase large subunit
MTVRPGLVGQPIPRVEDPRFLSGRSAYVDDVDDRGALHLAFVRSPFAAARILSMDLSACADVPGVMAVHTGADFAALPGFRSSSTHPAFTPVSMPLLAVDEVRHVGEPVAVIVACSRAAAEDGAELADVDYEPLPAVVSMRDALDPASRPVNAGTGSNVLLDVRQWDDPRVTALLDEAAVVVETTFGSGRLAASPMETRGCLAFWDDDRLQVQLSTQVPHLVRTAIAQQVGMPESAVRVRVPDVGGGFGLKCSLGREEVLTAVLAHRTRRPMKWIEDRQEHLTAGFHAREQSYTITAAFDADGKLSALDADIVCDVGAYSAYPFGYGIEPMQAASDMVGPYKVAAYRSRARAVATNKPTMSPYRGVSRPQVTLALEATMDRAARKLGIDPVDLRVRNLIQGEDFPYEGVTGLVYDPGSYRESLEACAERVDFATWPARQAQARAEGRLLGLGFSCFNEHVGYGTAVFRKRTMPVTVSGETVRAALDPSGIVNVYVGTLSHGQGHKTTYAQIVADQMGVPLEAVTIVQGDTDLIPFGWGTFASRSISVAGGAVRKAGEQLRHRVLENAAHLLEADAADLELVDGFVQVKGTPTARLSLAEVAWTSYYRSAAFPADTNRELEVIASYDPPGTFSNATPCAEVEIDPGTGAVHIRRFVVVEDCGVMINPLIVDGQVRGGVAQGIGAALYEQIRYDEAGQPTTSGFMDYLVPTATEIPPIEIFHIETPSAFTETGAKGMGEGGVIGAPAAVLNAVNDAGSHLGLEFTSVPITPAMVVAALEERTKEARDA